MDGIINVYKEKGYTSHDVVAKLRGIFGQKKIGHTGTLDPDATGVLPVCLGKATKVCGLLTEKKKTYCAEVQLGVVTDTQDMTGKILQEKNVSVTRAELDQTVASFLGESWQTPPMYSAVKIGGKRLYELARKGLEVEREKRKITVFHCNVLNYDEEEHRFTMEVTCSKGTYIRTLCHDMGAKLSCGAAMASLVRTSVDSFLLEDAYTLAQIEAACREGEGEKLLLPVDHIFLEYPAVFVSDGAVRFLKNGNRISENLCRWDQAAGDGEVVRMYDENRRFYALYRYEESQNCFVNVKMFYNGV